MAKAVTFGEIMLRLSPEGYYRFMQADRFEASFGGGEANVAVSLARFGIDTAFVTKLPKHEIGQMAINSLRRYGVDTSHIARGGERVGIYYLERGASQRGSLCIYDRAGSAIAEAELNDFDWAWIFEGAEWFHVTGITPALGEKAAALCLDACKTAKKMGLKVSCDLNYRSKLWSRDEAKKTMSEICSYVDICIANEEDAYDVFGIQAIGSNAQEGKLDHEGYKSVAKQLMDQFPFKMVAITLRTSYSASDNGWAAMIYDGAEYSFSKEYKIHIVDRVGGGDSFSGGLIYGLLQGYDPQAALEFAVAASCLKQTIEGDFNMVSVEEVKKLTAGNATGRVQR